jgi:hypothetical protein
MRAKLDAWIPLIFSSPMAKSLPVVAALILGTTLPQLTRAQQGCAVDSLGRVVCAPPGGGAAVDSLGRVVTGRGGCANDSLGRVVCSDTPGGGAANDSLGRVRTGSGQCVSDSLGRVMCSAVPGGGAAVDSLGRAVCVGGCVAGN